MITISHPKFAVMLQTNPRSTDRYKWVTLCVEESHALAFDIASRLNGKVVEQGGTEQQLLQTETWMRDN